MVTKHRLFRTLAEYYTAYPQESHRLYLANVILLHCQEDPCDPACMPAHFSANAVLLNAEGAVLMTLAPRRWGPQFDFPGGHVQACDTSLLDTARRHLCAATGLLAGDIEPLPGQGDTPLEYYDDQRFDPGDEIHVHRTFTYAWQLRPDIAPDTTRRLSQDPATFRWVPPEQLHEGAIVQRKVRQLVAA